MSYFYLISPEPLIIVVIDFFVGAILVSMYLPMFRLSSVLGG